MDFFAKMRVIVKVPFSADGETSEERIAAARHAEDAIADQLTALLASAGEVANILVEEVYEAGEPA